jgi:hypothetical protein
MKKKILQTLTFCGVFLAWISASMAQSTGTLSGRITVRAGEPVPNATVIVTSVNNGNSLRVLTAPDGSFTLSGLAPGSYRVEIESAGFKRASQQNVELVAGGPAEVNIVLEPGDAQTTVEATATTRTIQDDSGQIAKSLGPTILTQLPVQDRNHQELIGLLPGITPPYTPWSLIESPQQNRAWETNGQPNWANLRLMDGFKNHEPVTGRSVYVMPMQSIRQMNVATSNHEAQFGRAGGAIVNNHTRPGTNDFHGNLFWQHRNEWWGARDYFNAPGTAQAKDRANQFGGSAGGHIVRDRVFFFGAYEGDLYRTGLSRFTTLPTAEMRAGDFSGIPGITLFDPNTGSAAGFGRAQFAGNMIPAGRINPISRAILNELPLPNQPGVLNNYFANVATRNDGHRGIGRLDFYLTDQTNLYAREAYSNFLVAQPSVLNSDFFGGGTNSRLRNHNALVSVAHRFSPTFSLDAGLGYSRYNNRKWGSNAADAEAFGFREPFGGLTGSGAFPNISIGGMDLLGNNPNFPGEDVTNSWNFNANAGIMHGRHNVRWGADIWHTRFSGFENWMYGPNAAFTFGAGGTLSPGVASGMFGAFPNAFASFLLGAPTQTARAFNTTMPQLRTTEYAGYIADTVKVTDRLTLSLGLRYEAFLPVETANNTSFFNFGSSRINLFSEGSSDFGVDQPFDSNNFAPRFGFAYRFAERTVVRGGYGISYFRPTLNWFAQTFTPEMFTGMETGVASGFGIVRGGFAGQLPLVMEAPSDNTLQNRPLSYMRNDTETPYMQSYSFQVQHDFGRGASFDIAYVGNLGRHLPYTREMNAALAGAGVAGLPLAGSGRTASTHELGTGMTSKYNALQVSVNKRFTNFLSLAGAYTWSKALDNGNGLLPFQNNSDIFDNYGAADWDRRHIFSLSHVWEPFGSMARRSGVLGSLLAGWELSGIVRWVSGNPLTVTGDPFLCNCPGNTARADVIGTGTVTRIIPQPTIWGYWVGVPFRFPVFEFQQPAAGAFGNLSRNSVYGDGFFNYNMALAKSFQITEQGRLQLRGEVYNLTNTPHFANPVTDVNSINFGQSLMSMPGYGARSLQLGARFIF